MSTDDAVGKVIAAIVAGPRAWATADELGLAGVKRAAIAAAIAADAIEPWPVPAGLAYCPTTREAARRGLSLDERWRLQADGSWLEEPYWLGPGAEPSAFATAPPNDRRTPFLCRPRGDDRDRLASLAWGIEPPAPEPKPEPEPEPETMGDPEIRTQAQTPADARARNQAAAPPRNQAQAPPASDYVLMGCRVAVDRRLAQTKARRPA